MNARTNPDRFESEIMPVTHTRLAVPGMRCAGCISKLEGGLARLPGVISARVDFGAKQVVVQHEAGVDLPRLLAAVEALGFDAHAMAGAQATQANAELRGLVRALAVAGFATMNIMLLSVSVWSGATGANRQMFHLISALIAIPAILYSGQPFFRSAWAALQRGRTNMDVPISIGVALATGLSAYETFAGGAEAWFDGAMMLIFFLLAGRVLDAMMRERARKGAAALMAASAPGAMVLDDDGLAHWTAADAIRPGMRMLVAAGEGFAADGRVEEGTSRVDAAMMTGESAAVAVKAGDTVYAGTRNCEAPLTVLVTAAGEDRTVAGIARAMNDAGQHRSAYVRVADRAARLYAPVVHGLALAAFLGWVLAGAGVYQAAVIAISVLIVTCPCALGLAVPVAQVVASGRLMQLGVLVKDGSALERLAEADRLVLDKTGTLTRGEAVPAKLDELNTDQMRVALALAQASRHPLSCGLARALASMSVRPAPLEKVSETPGEGMHGWWKSVPVGLLRSSAASGPDLSVALHIGGHSPVTIGFHDVLRPDAEQAIARCTAMGLNAIVLSGDRYAPVHDLACRLGVTAIAGMKPLDKLECVERLRAAGTHPLMVGDGLNDGPALAAAHVSMAPGNASDVGHQASDLVFMGDSLLAIPRAVAVARATRGIVRQNFALAIAYNICAVPLALAGMVTPLIAAIAMSASSIVVVANALRLWRSGQ